MSQPIAVGDLVAVVKPTPCCGNSNALGLHFVVLTLSFFGFGKCAYCGHMSAGADAMVARDDFILLSRLKRIPPLEELDDVKRDETIEA